MALTFSVDYPKASGSKGGRPFFDFKTEQQYFKLDYSGAAANDKIYIEQEQAGTWYELAAFTITSSGDGSIKDLVGDFDLRGNPLRIVAKNSNGSTTYLTETYYAPSVNPKVKKDLNMQLDDLFVHSGEHGIKDLDSRVYLPALEETVTLIDAEDNSVLSPTTISSSLNLSSNNLDVLPRALQLAVLKNSSGTFINGVEAKSFPQATNSNFSGAGGTVSATNKPFIVGDNKVYKFSQTSNDGGLENGRKFLKVFKAAMGKNMYKALAQEKGSAHNDYADYIQQKNTYNSIASSKVTELF